MRDGLQFKTAPRSFDDPFHVARFRVTALHENLLEGLAFKPLEPLRGKPVLPRLCTSLDVVEVSPLRFKCKSATARFPFMVGFRMRYSKDIEMCRSNNKCFHGLATALMFPNGEVKTCSTRIPASSSSLARSATLYRHTGPLMACLDDISSESAAYRCGTGFERSE